MVVELIEAGEFTAFPDALRFVPALRGAGMRLAAASSSKRRSRGTGHAPSRPATRLDHAPWPPAWTWISSASPRRSIVIVSSGCGAKTVRRAGSRWVLSG
jgi:hypothetical protein